MFKDMFKTCSQQQCADTALLALRIAVAFIFVMHGYSKLFGGMPGFTMMIDKLGFPIPAFFAWFVAVLEFGGGIAILLGLWTQLLGSMLAVEMLIIIVFVKKFSFPKADIDLALLAMCVALVMAGAGKYAFKLKPVAPPQQF